MPETMDPQRTTADLQNYLNDLACLRGDSPAEPLVRDLLGRAAQRLHLLCASLLHRRYPRLMRSPLNLETGDLLSGVVERLLKAMRDVRPQTVRQFFALANQHMRWELNDLARRLDQQTPALALPEHSLAVDESSGSTISPMAAQLLDAIEGLPEEEREVFDLVRIQGLTQPEVANLLGVSVKTVQRRLGRGWVLLEKKVGDLRPAPNH